MASDSDLRSCSIGILWEQAARKNRRRRAVKLSKSLAKLMRFLFYQAGFPPQPGLNQYPQIRTIASRRKTAWRPPLHFAVAFILALHCSPFHEPIRIPARSIPVHHPLALLCSFHIAAGARSSRRGGDGGGGEQFFSSF